MPAAQRLCCRQRRGRGRPGAGDWAGIRVALGGVADQPVVATAAGDIASGSRLTDEVIADAAQAALEVADPPSESGPLPSTGATWSPSTCGGC